MLRNVKVGLLVAVGFSAVACTPAPAPSPAQTAETVNISETGSVARDGACSRYTTWDITNVDGSAVTYDRTVTRSAEGVVSITGSAPEMPDPASYGSCADVLAGLSAGSVTKAADQEPACDVHLALVPGTDEFPEVLPC